jgi:hypothetical protein
MGDKNLDVLPMFLPFQRDGKGIRERGGRKINVRKGYKKGIKSTT